MNLKKEADLIEEQGRYGDTELVHLNPMEVKWLEKMTPGGKLTRNPVTGKKEAFWGIVMAIASIVSTGAGIAASKKNRAAQEKMAQEAAYIEGAAPVIPNANQLEIDPIGDSVPAEMAAPDFRVALEETYGGDMYDSPQFQGEQIPPELMELMQQQQMSGQEPTNVQFANSGGPVGLPEDVYNFPVEKINQMQMDVDPGVRNVGNAMMAQMEANPGMGMVGASAADIDQMAAGGPVRPKKYRHGSKGGVEGTGVLALLEQLLPPDKEHMAVDEYDSDGNLIERSITYSSSKEGDPLVSKARTEADEVQMMSDFFSEDQLRRLRGGMGGPSLSEIIPRYEQRRIPQKSDFPLRRQAEIAMGLEALAPKGIDREELEAILKNTETPPRLDEMLQFVKTETQEGRKLSDRDLKFMQMQMDQERMFNEFLETEASMATGGPVQPRRYDDGGVIQEAIVDTVTNQIPGVSQAKILRAIEMTDDPEEKRRLARQLIPGYGLGEMGAQGVKALGRKIKERPRMRAWRARRRGEGIPEMGPQMRNDGGSVRPKKYQDGSEGGIRELYKKIPTNLRLLGEYLAGAESPITEKDFTTEELDVIRNQIVAQKINNEALEDEYRKAGNADAVETFETTRGRTSVSPYDIQESGLPTTKTTFGRSYLSGGSGAVDKGWEESLKSLNDPSYTVATSLGKYTAEDIDDGFRIRENYDFNKGSLERPSPIQDIESLDQLKNLLWYIQATPEVVGETLANMVRSEPRAVDIRL